MLPQGHSARRLRITGRVQGVGYRAWVARQAEAAGLSGFVRNRTDGSVDCLLSGPQAAVEALIAACHEGPAAAAVAGVAVSEAQGMTPGRFRLLPAV